MAKVLPNFDDECCHGVIREIIQLVTDKIFKE